MPHPYPGQEWRHGWIPVTPQAAKSKNHGRRPGRNSAISRLVAEAAEIHNRMKAQDAERGKKPGAKSPSAPKPPAAKPIAEKKPAPTNAPATKPQAKPPAAPKSPPKPAAAKPGKKAGTDSHGKTLREGDEVRITGGAGQGKNGHVISKGKAGTVRVRTEDGREVDVHDINVRNRQDHETSRKADAAIRNATGRTPATPPAEPQAGGASIPEIQNHIRDAYNKLARQPGAWVSLTRLRERLAKNLPRQKVDEALRLLNRMPGVNLVPENNQKMLTKADRDAAVRLGDQDKHNIAIGV